MKKLSEALPALGSKQRKVLLFSSAALFVLWGTGYFVEVVRAQGKAPILASPVVAIVSPKGGDARKEIHYDPFYDSVDPAAPDASSLIGSTKSNGSMVFSNPTSSALQMPALSMGGDGIGVPDVSYGQPIMMPGQSTIQSGSATPAPGAPAVTGNAVSYAGRITGNPPIAVLRWPSGATRVVHWHEMTSAGRITSITPDAVTFANGLTLPFNPTPVVAPSPNVTATPEPISTFTPTVPVQPTPSATLPPGATRSVFPMRPGLQSSAPVNSTPGVPFRTPPPGWSSHSQIPSGGQP